MAEQETNPLIAALPPHSDYFTYLTVLEYNLDKSQLDLLHKLLQDVKLTTNIGWDLVHLLLPLLPESKECLQDIAFLGNPRETILKVAELLEGLGQSRGSVAGDDVDTKEEDQNQEEDDDDDDDESTNAPAPQSTEAHPVDVLATQFHELLHMLCILHPRIKTKKPSGFLITSLKAVINAYRNLQQGLQNDNPTERLQSCTRSVLMVIKSLSGSKRPNLPPRRSQSAIPTVATREAAADPEGSHDSIEPGETELQKQILQSFLTQVLSIYIQSLEPIESVDSALSWSTRYYEHTNTVPGKPKFVQAYEIEEEIERAEATINQILSSAQNDVNISWDTLLHCLSDEAHTDENHKSIFTIPEFPASKLGSLYALAAKAATSALNNRRIPFNISAFPEHSLLTELFVDDVPNDIDVDALVVLGRAALETNGIGNWETRAEFNQYLQRLLELAANTGLSNVASQASELASSILHLHPSSDARFDFILDTLKDCPYPEFKEAAVFWLRDEINTAFKVLQVSKQSASEDTEPETADFGEMSNVFTHPETIKSAAAVLFARPQTENRQDVPPSTQAKVWLATLNLYYLLCASDVLYEKLDVHDLNSEFKVEKEFLAPLEKLVEDSHSAPPGTSNEGYGPFIPLIDDALQRLKALGKREEATEQAREKPIVG